MIKWTRSILLSRIPTPSKSSRLLFISRKMASSRRCINEGQIYSLLAPLGFEIVYLEYLTLIDQLRLFSEASFIVGAHGAGFTNILVCKSTTTIIELLPDHGAYNHFYLMSSVLSMRHAHYVGKLTNKITKDFFIDPTSFMSLMGALLPNWPHE